MFRFVFLGKIHQAVFRKAAQAASTTVSEHEQKLELCRLPVEEALQRFGVTESGLPDEQVETPREEYGSNVLSHTKPPGILMELLQGCRNPLVIQLLVICLVSLLMGDRPGGHGCRRHSLSKRGASLCAGASLQPSRGKAPRDVQTNCLVMRDAKEYDIPMTEIVPGDIVILQAGALIPADLRLISAKDFFVGQSNKRLLSEDLLHVPHFALDFAGDLLSRPAVP
jgi:Mg2+-importing ATPase